MDYGINNKSFNRGLTDRANYPLTRGGYKLRETKSYLARLARNAHHILDYKSKVAQSIMICCTQEDMHKWVKKTPGDVAELFGRNVMPAVEALAEDGLREVDIQLIKQWHLSKIRKLMQKCEILSNKLKQGAHAEYIEWQKGNYPLIELLEESFGLVSSILVMSGLSHYPCMGIAINKNAT